MTPGQLLMLIVRVAVRAEDDGVAAAVRSMSFVDRADLARALALAAALLATQLGEKDREQLAGFAIVSAAAPVREWGDQRYSEVIPA